MNLYNIKDNSEQVSFAQAVRQGLGRDQGLFFPEVIAPLADVDALLDAFECAFPNLRVMEHGADNIAHCAKDREHAHLACKCLVLDVGMDCGEPEPIGNKFTHIVESAACQDVLVIVGLAGAQRIKLPL